MGTNALAHKKRRLLSLLLILGFIGLLVAELYWSHQTEIRNAERVVDNLTRVLERHAMSTVEKIDLVLQHVQFALTSAVMKGLPASEVEPELKSLLASLPESQSLRIIDSNGKIIYDAGGFRSSTNIADRHYFIRHRDHRDSGLVISEPIFARFTSNWVITISRRLSFPDGSFAGLIQAAVRADYFENFYRTLNVGNGSIALYDRESRLIARMPRVDNMIGKVPGPSVRNRLMEQGFDNGIYESVSNVDHATRIHAFRRVEGFPLVVLAGISKDDLLKEWRIKAFIYIFSSTLLSFLLFSLFSSLRRQSSIAERLATVKSAFLANMSHEIRTPLNAILGFTHLMKAEATTSRQLDQLKKIDVAANHLRSIVNDILDLSKIDSGKFLLDRQEFVLDALLSNVRSILTPAAEAKGIHLVLESDVSGQMFIGDPTRLSQILLNFGSNAVKFSEQGKVVFRATIQRDGADAVLLRFEVEDDGIGVSSEAQDRLFKAFEQADSTTTRKYGGSGLGLSISKKLAELMGGSIGVESQLGKGSKFWVTVQLEKSMNQLPDVPQMTGPTEPPEQVLQRDFQDKRLLLVEDEPINQEIAREMLAETGIRVYVANHGREAIEMILKDPYDIVLMDMQMPEMDGLQATREIRQLAWMKDIPILAMTANAFEDDRLRCIEVGMNDFIPKPVIPDFLYAKILFWLQKSRQ